MAVSDQIINPALRKIGVLSASEVPSSQEQSDAFQALNMMIESFSNERLMIYSILRESFSLVGGQQTYQMGSGAPDFNTTRPMQIINALIVAPGTTPTAEIPMRIINKDEYAAIVVKTVTSAIPLYLYNDDAYPYANLNIWPVSSGVGTMILYSWKPIADFAAVTSAVSLPPGYLELLVYNLAVRLAPDYGRVLPEEITAIAIAAKENVKRMNTKPQLLGADAALRGPKGSFNWITGDTT